MYSVNYRMPTTCLRLFTVSRPRQRPDMALSLLVTRGVRGGVVELYGDGEHTCDWTFVGDVVAAMARRREVRLGGRLEHRLRLPVPNRPRAGPAGDGRLGRRYCASGMTSQWPPAPPAVVPLSALPYQAARTRIKVLHVVTRFIAGAGGNTLLSVLGADRERYEVWVAGAPGGPLWERAERHGVTTVKLGRLREIVSPLDDMIVLLQLFRLIRRERFSVVHTHSTKAGVLGRLAAWLCRTPVIVHTIHGFSTHDFMSARRRRTYLAIERLVRPITHEFLAVAPEVAREAVEKRLASPGSVSVVPSAVELDVIPKGPDPEIRREFGIPADAPLVGTVGRLDAQKAPLDFIRMAALVSAAHPSTRFVMVGDGELLDAAREAARSLDVRVTFTGFRPDAPRVAACFDVFVISSLYEGLGRALTEALGSGRPVVATAVNGVIDLIEPGSTGLLAPPGDPQTLARSVTWLLEHPDDARRMGEAGRARVRAIFQPALMCALIEQTYGRLLGLPETTPLAGRAVELTTAHGSLESAARHPAERPGRVSA
jgi:glycosyltransferase involved in cell wall biosynthesis